MKFKVKESRISYPYFFNVGKVYDSKDFPDYIIEGLKSQNLIDEDFASIEKIENRLILTTPYTNSITVSGVNNNLVAAGYGIDTSKYVGSEIEVSYISLIGKKGITPERFNRVDRFLWDSTGTSLANYNPEGSVEIEPSSKTITKTFWPDNERMYFTQSFKYKVKNNRLFIVFAMYSNDNNTGVSFATSIDIKINGVSISVDEKGVGKTFGSNPVYDWLGNAEGTYFFDPYRTPNSTLRFEGKKIGAIGDSITFGVDSTKTYGEIVAQTYGMKFTNYGISGSTISVNPSKPTERNPMIERFNSMDDNLDIIIVAGGTNDWFYSWTPPGTFSSRNNNEFYGAVHNICLGMLEKYKGKQIIFMTPIKRAYAPLDQPDSVNNYDLSLQDVADIIKEVCSFYGLPVIDMFRECPIVPWVDSIKTALIPDGVHPNAAGHKVMADRIINYLGN